MVFRLNNPSLQTRSSRMLLHGALLLAVAVSLGGCMQSNSSDSGTGDAGTYVYKGKIDPLTTQPVAERTAKLSERFKLVQGRQ